MKLRARSLEIANYFAMGITTYRDRFLVQASFWLAAVAVGVMAVLFTNLIARSFRKETLSN